MGRKNPLEAAAKKLVKDGAARSAAIAALVQKGATQSAAREAVDIAISGRGAGKTGPSGAGTMLVGLGMMGLGGLLTLIVPNLIFTGLLGTGLIVFLRGILGRSVSGEE